MRYLNKKAIVDRCHELHEGQVSTEFLIALDVKVEDILKKSCEWFGNKKRITEMVTK
jgi:hypothetical protein